MLIHEDVISGNFPILVKLPNGDEKILRLIVGGKLVPEVRLGKIKIPPKAILGQKYGSTFSNVAGTREWTRIQRSELRGALAEDEEDTELAMPEMVGHLRAVESAMNNEAFLSKTKFSQEKYLRKKHEKFAKEITVLKPRVEDFGEIRGDMLGSLIRFSAAKNGSRIAAVDDAGGILVAALLLRGSSVDRFVFGRSTGQEKALYMFGVEKSVNVVRDERPPKHDAYDSIVIAHNGTSECEIGTLFDSLEPKLILGGTLAIYARNVEPLLELLKRLRAQPEDGEETRFINVQLTEQMAREIEILKERTHPIMQQSTHLFQGFILSAIKVAS